jgi:hypothetical protein
MLFREIIAVYCENHTEHIITLRGQNVAFVNVIAGGTYSSRGLKGFVKYKYPSMTTLYVSQMLIFSFAYIFLLFVFRSKYLYESISIK